ncbi:hypothetical protein QAD02_007648 [Eretmocerus hayati]|uniref:Uncharacterized protein n=1 Tax=Eretmocerus hayati TaxID=131215 RepID=A0ACC2N512_9HYME|nr:hypothetical protein QAD02_007648 [Eretmocerus hayati]
MSMRNDQSQPPINNGGYFVLRILKEVRMESSRGKEFSHKIAVVAESEVPADHHVLNKDSNVSMPDGGNLSLSCHAVLLLKKICSPSENIPLEPLKTLIAMFIDWFHTTLSSYTSRLSHGTILFNLNPFSHSRNSSCLYVFNRMCLAYDRRAKIIAMVDTIPLKTAQGPLLVSGITKARDNCVSAASEISLRNHREGRAGA